MPNIYLIILTFGFVGGYNYINFFIFKVLFQAFFLFTSGVAFGCSYLSCFMILNDYFDKKLATANGITMAGSGVGAFAFSPFIKFLIENLQWKITLIILGN
jgi:MFS family permease